MLRSSPDVVDWLDQARTLSIAVLSRAALPLVLVLAFAVRAYYVLRAEFPLNDGGLFYAMARDIQANGYRLPAFTTYDSGEIPFAYPPASMYLAALLDDLTPASLETWFRVLPLVGSVLTVWALWHLARTMLQSEAAAGIAALAFALVPSSFAWLLMGGGLPRSFGLAFALLAMREGYLLLQEPAVSKRRGLGLAVLAAATLLTHLETAVVLALTLALMAIGRPGVGVLRLGSAGLLAAVFAAWWLVLVITRHGLSPFIAARASGGRLIDDGWVSPEWVIQLLRNPVFTAEPYFPVIDAFGVVGGLLALCRGRWFLPAWWFVLAFVAMRAFPTFLAVPSSLLAGMAAETLWLSIARQGEHERPTRMQIAGLATAGTLVLTLMTQGAVAGRGGATDYLQSLSRSDRAAMEWVRGRVPADAKFLVIPVEAWHGDYVGEWFPALAARESVLTPQGYEWLPRAHSRSDRGRTGICSPAVTQTSSAWSRSPEQPASRTSTSRLAAVERSETRSGAPRSTPSCMSGTPSSPGSSNSRLTLR